MLRPSLPDGAPPALPRGPSIDHRGPGAQVRHAELGAPGDVARAQDVAVEPAHRVDVAHAQDDVVDVADLYHA
jgi:hypothetical protein